MLKTQTKNILKVIVVLLLLLLVICAISFLKNILTRHLINGICSLLAIFITYKWLDLNENIQLFKFNILKTILIAVSINALGLSVFFFNNEKYEFKFQPITFTIHIIEAVILAAFIEEFWFRRILIGEIFKNSKNQNFLNFAVAIFFSINHVRYFWPNLMYHSIANVFIFSLLISKAYFKTRNLTTVIIIHSLGNLMSFFSSYVFQFTQTLNIATKITLAILTAILFGGIYFKVLKSYSKH